MVRRRVMAWGMAAALAGCARFGYWGEGRGDAAAIDAPLSPPPDTARPADQAAPTNDRALPPADSGRWGSGTWELGPVERLTELNSPRDETEISLLADGLTLFFASKRTGGVGEKDVYRARRPHRGAPFGEITNLTGINTPEIDELMVTPAGLVAALASARPGGLGKVDLWTAARATLDDDWASAPVVHQTAVSSADDDWDPFLSADGLRLYFAPMAHGQQQVLRMAVRPSLAAPFGPPTPVPGITDDGRSSDPALTLDERVLVFASSAAEGNDDLWYALRADRDAPFGLPQRLPGEVNTPYEDREPFISADGTELYFSSSRPGGQGELDFYCVEIRRGP